jgi:hypothetical protein
MKLLILSLFFSVPAFADSVLKITPLQTRNIVVLDPVNFQVKQQASKTLLYLSGKIYHKNVSLVYKDKYITVGEAIPVGFSVYVDMTGKQNKEVSFVVIDSDGVILREVYNVGIKPNSVIFKK